MSHTDLGRLDLAALRAAAEDAEFAEAEARLLDSYGYRLRYCIYRDTRQAMNAAIGCVLAGFGYQITPFGSGGAWLVTGCHIGGTEAGQ